MTDAQILARLDLIEAEFKLLRALHLDDFGEVGDALWLDTLQALIVRRNQYRSILEDRARGVVRTVPAPQQGGPAARRSPR